MLQSSRILVHQKWMSSFGALFGFLLRKTGGARLGGPVRVWVGLLPLFCLLFFMHIYFSLRCAGCVTSCRSGFDSSLCITCR